MTEKIMKRALAGDVDAMIILGDAYASSGDKVDYDSMTNALQWYERAADAGNSYGAMQAILTHNIFALLSEKLLDFKEEIMEYEKVIELTDRIFKIRNIDKDTKVSARKEYIKAHYKIAGCYYILHEYRMAMAYLDGIDAKGFKKKLLKGLCEYQLAENETGWRKAYRLLYSIEEQLLLFDGSENMDIMEQIILAQGYIILSHIYYFGIGGTSENVKRAYRIVMTAYQTITDEGLREDLIASELERYK